MRKWCFNHLHSHTNPSLRVSKAHEKKKRNKGEQYQTNTGTLLNNSLQVISPQRQNLTPSHLGGYVQTRSFSVCRSHYRDVNMASSHFLASYERLVTAQESIWWLFDNAHSHSQEEHFWSGRLNAALDAAREGGSSMHFLWRTINTHFKRNPCAMVHRYQ